MLLVRSFYHPTEGIRLTLLSTKCIEIEDIRIFVAVLKCLMCKNLALRSHIRIAVAAQLKLC